MKKLKKYDREIENHYNKVADQYKSCRSCTMDDNFTRQSETDFIKNSIRQIIRKTKILNQNILDVGCGNGFTLSEVRKITPQARLEGFEINKKLRKLAKAKKIKNCEIRYGRIS